MRRNIGKNFITFFSAVLIMLLQLAGTAHAQLVWKGHTWNETTGGMAGVAQGNPANISVDANGYLHLTITNRNGTYTASEMFTQDNIGFGTYQYWIQGAVDNMDKSTVLGLFPYGPAAGIGADGENELDIELSHWNNGGCTTNPNCNADFTYYPSTGNKAVGPTEDDFIFSLNGGTLLTARLEWSSTSVTGTLMSGLQPIGTTQNVLRTFTLAPSDYTVRIPQTALPLGINLWSYQSLPASNQEVIIQDFQFVPQGSADFGFSATPASRTVTAGNGTTYTASASPLNGFTGTVSLTVSGLPPGAGASFNPASISGGSGSSTLNVSSSNTTPAGNYTLTVTGSSGSLSHSSTVALVVNPAVVPGFAVSASPSSQMVTAGSGTSYSATVSAVNGFTGAVALSASGLPAGASVSFSPASVTGSGTSTMSLTTSASTGAGAYTLTITGTSGSVSHAATVTLIVNAAPAPNFTLSASPSSQTVTVGSGTSYTAAVNAVNGFTGAVALSASGLPAGASVSFNPATVTGSGNSTVNVTTSGSTLAGTYTLTLTGVSGTLSHTTTVTLVVNPVGGSPTNIAPNGKGYIWHTLPSQTGTNNQTAATGINDGNLTVGVNADTAGEPSQNQYEAGGIIFTTAQSGITQVNFINGQIDTYGNGNFEQNLALQTYNGTAWSNVAGWTLSPAYPYTTAAGGVTYSFTGAALNGVLGVRVVGLLRCSCLDNSWSWIVNEVQIYASASSNFSLSASPASLTVTAGSGTSYTATVSAVNGFTGAVAFSASGLPTGASASFNPASVNGSGTSTVSVTTSSSTPAGMYTLTLTGTSGSLTHSATVTLVVNAAPVPNFTFSASPSSQTVTVGGGTSYTATVSPVNGFTGAVAFSASGLPTGVSATFNPTSVNGSGTSTVSVTTSGSTLAGTYALTLTGSSGSVTHSASVTLVVNPVAGTPVYQINSGGPVVAPFAADAYFTGGTADVTTGGTVDTSAVTNPAPEPVYDTERWGPFTYTVPSLTPAASYTVRLHFAEIYWTAAGQRSFNVLINGTQVLTNFDIIAAAGAAKKAIVKQFTATANGSGQIVVQYTAGVNSNDNNPKSSAIEIIH
jgi:hypothetical protein